MIKAPLETHRVKYKRGEPYYSDSEDGPNGCWEFYFKHKGPLLRVICGVGDGWEHVSVSLAHRCATWDEMCFIKSKFWDDEDCVVQYHPPKKDYVNVHPYVLHLWRPISDKWKIEGLQEGDSAPWPLPMPPTWMIG